MDDTTVIDINGEKQQITLNKFQYLHKITCNTVSYKMRLYASYITLFILCNIIGITLLYQIVDDHVIYLVIISCVIATLFTLCVVAKLIHINKNNIYKNGLLSFKADDISWKPEDKSKYIKLYNSYKMEHDVCNMLRLINGYYLYNINSDYIKPYKNITICMYIKTFLLPYKYNNIDQNMIYKGIYILI